LETVEPKAELGRKKEPEGAGGGILKDPKLGAEKIPWKGTGAGAGFRSSAVSSFLSPTILSSTFYPIL